VSVRREAARGPRPHEDDPGPPALPAGERAGPRRTERQPTRDRGEQRQRSPRLLDDAKAADRPVHRAPAEDDLGRSDLGLHRGGEEGDLGPDVRDLLVGLLERPVASARLAARREHPERRGPLEPLHDRRVEAPLALPRPVGHESVEDQVVIRRHVEDDPRELADAGLRRVGARELGPGDVEQPPVGEEGDPAHLGEVEPRVPDLPAAPLIRVVHEDAVVVPRSLAVGAGEAGLVQQRVRAVPDGDRSAVHRDVGPVVAERTRRPLLPEHGSRRQPEPQRRVRPVLPEEHLVAVVEVAARRDVLRSHRLGEHEVGGPQLPAVREDGHLAVGGKPGSVVEQVRRLVLEVRAPGEVHAAGVEDHGARGPPEALAVVEGLVLVLVPAVASEELDALSADHDGPVAPFSRVRSVADDAGGEQGPDGLAAVVLRVAGGVPVPLEDEVAVDPGEALVEDAVELPALLGREARDDPIVEAAGLEPLHAGVHVVARGHGLRVVGVLPERPPIGIEVLDEPRERLRIEAGRAVARQHDLGQAGVAAHQLGPQRNVLERPDALVLADGDAREIGRTHRIGHGRGGRRRLLLPRRAPAGVADEVVERDPDDVLARRLDLEREARGDASGGLIVEIGQVEPGGVDVLAVERDARRRHAPLPVHDLPGTGVRARLLRPEEGGQAPRVDRVRIRVADAADRRVEAAHVERAVAGDQVEAPDRRPREGPPDLEPAPLRPHREPAHTVREPRRLAGRSAVHEVRDRRHVVPP
jgi:hypothetical protein